MSKVCLCILILTFPFLGKAQLVADFEADTLSFCPPRTVRFKDLSTGGNITSRVWSFSPTQNSNSNNPFPIATYTSPGTYTVSLTVSDGSRTVTRTKTAYIKVFQPPAADFSISGIRRDCAPLNVQINDQTVLGDTSISWTRYALGDGSLSYSPSPNYTYNSGGVFSLTLQVIDDNGCQSSKSRAQYVEVFPKPLANFGTKNSPHDCQAPHFVEFDDQSKGRAPMSYAWTFGDGNTSTGQNPNNTYSTGVFDVGLSIIDANGCKDTVIKPAYASVTSTNANFQVPDTICINDTLSIQNLSVGGNTYSWDFGDGTSSADRDVKKVYPNSGTYRIKLSISAGANCFDSISRIVYVDKVEAAFTQDRFFSCQGRAVNYSDASIGNRINSWKWTFNGTDTNITQNPAYNYTDAGVYDAQLIVSTVHGCSDTIIKLSHFELAVLNPSIDNSVDSGCAPLLVNFIDRSGPRDSIASRTWEWGDGSAPDTSAATAHTFSNPGLYIVRLTVVSKSGCSYSITKRIIVGSLQTPNFVIDHDTICAGDGLQITNLSTDSTIITSYSWKFSDGGEFLGKDPDPYQPVDTGYLSVSLKVEHNGCYDSIQRNRVIYVNGPVGQMSLGIDCDKPYDVGVLGVNWKGVTRFKWKMGDFIGEDTTRQTFTYTYQNRGRYKVEMKLYNDSNGCEYFKDQFAEIYDLMVNVTADDTIFCAPQELRLSANGSQDASLLQYTNLLTNQDTITNQWTVPFLTRQKGLQTFRMIGMSPNGCRDTAYEHVRGFKPEAEFIVADTLGCFPMTTTFRDRSVSDTSIVRWRWFLGAGIQGTNSVETVTYPLKGNFGVQLQVEDVFGCKDTITKLQLIDIRQPSILFDPDSMLCAGDSVELYNISHNIGYSYSWTSAGQLNTDTATKFGFLQSGLIPIQSIVTDSSGCTDTMIREVNVQAIPQPALSASPRDTNCYPALVSFNDLTNHPNITSRTWSFGLGDPPVTRSNANAVYTYPFPGKYDVTLIVETSFGCKDSVSFADYISVGGPYGAFDLQNDSTCVGEAVNFELDSIFNTFRIDWDYGDGTGAQLPGSEKRSTHVFKNSGTYGIKVLLNDTAFDCLTSVEDTIEIFEVIAELSTGDTSGCAPLAVEFRDNSQFANGRSWLNSQNIISQNAIDTFSYVDPGLFQVRLVATNSVTGCSDTSSQFLEVFPVPEIEISEDTVICIGNELLLRASGATSYQWSPWQGLSSTSDSDVVAKPEVNTTYRVVAKNDFDCLNMDSVNISLQRPYVFEASDDTTIFLGESAPMTVLSEDTALVFRWNPVNDLSCNLCPNPIANPQQTTTYTALITDQFGCFMANAEIVINVVEEYDVHIPTAFTPNTDGVNDWFYSVTYGIKELNFLRVYDRWGKLLFESKDLSTKWDGMVGGSQCPIGTYVWEFEGTRYNDRIVNLVGVINLIR